jgi:hypothetical protein
MERDHRRDERGSDDGGQGGVAFEHLRRVQTAGLKVPCELLAAEHAAQLGEQKGCERR